MRTLPLDQCIGWGLALVVVASMLGVVRAAHLRMERDRCRSVCAAPDPVGEGKLPAPVDCACTLPAPPRAEAR